MIVIYISLVLFFVLIFLYVVFESEPRALCMLDNFLLF